MRYLCIDLGEKRTGIAAGDDVTRSAGPIDVLSIPLGPQLREGILKVIHEHGPHALVIGLPLNMDGTEGEAAKRVRIFGDELANAANLPIHYQDERLTSYAADQSMSQSGRTHKQKKELRDALAAVEILRDYLDGQV